MEYLTISQAALKIGCSKRWINEAILTSALPASQLGFQGEYYRPWVIDSIDLELWRQRRRPRGRPRK
jgi:hypothetical protein